MKVVSTVFELYSKEGPQSLRSDLIAHKLFFFHNWKALRASAEP